MTPPSNLSCVSTVPRGRGAGGVGIGLESRVEAERGVAGRVRAWWYGLVPDGEVGEAAERGWLTGIRLKSRPQSSWRAARVPYPQEDAGSFPGVLTTEKVSRQAKGSVQSELQGKILGDPERHRRKAEPRKRECVPMELN